MSWLSWLAMDRTSTSSATEERWASRGRSRSVRLCGPIAESSSSGASPDEEPGHEKQGDNHHAREDTERGRVPSLR